MRFGTLFGVGQLLAGCCAFSAPRYGGPPSDHFDGARFVNQQPTDVAGPIEFLRWQRTRQPRKWERVEKADPGPPPPKRVEGGGLRVTWIGHASMLVQIDGLNLLADPVWSRGHELVLAERPPDVDATSRLGQLGSFSFAFVARQRQKLRECSALDRGGAEDLETVAGNTCRRRKPQPEIRQR